MLYDVIKVTVLASHSHTLVLLFTATSLLVLVLFFFVSVVSVVKINPNVSSRSKQQSIPFSKFRASKNHVLSPLLHSCRCRHVQPRKLRAEHTGRSYLWCTVPLRLNREQNCVSETKRLEQGEARELRRRVFGTGERGEVLGIQDGRRGSWNCYCACPGGARGENEKRDRQS